MHIAACVCKALYGGGFRSPFCLETDGAWSRERASLLGEAVPRAAGWAFALPFAARCAAGLANIVLSELHNWELLSSCPSPTRGEGTLLLPSPHRIRLRMRPRLSANS